MMRLLWCSVILFVRIQSLLGNSVWNWTKVEKEVEEINSCQKSWKADYTSLSKLNTTDFVMRMGSALKRHKRDHHRGPKSSGIVSISNPLDGISLSTTDIPIQFDARQKWPNCSSMQYVPDQGNCGCCWAIATATSFADRVCVASGQTNDRLLSGEELLTCCWDCAETEDGCQGGYIDAAFSYLEENGVVTGGGYQSNVGCKPFSIPPCTVDYCQSVAQAPDCHRRCTNLEYSRPYRRDKTYSGKTIYIGGNETLAQLLLINFGSLAGTMAMYSDFRLYKEGIYQRTNASCNTKVGYHAVRTIGWGTENGTDYWLVVNSWNVLWGENGFFRIDRKNNGCEFGEFWTSIPDRE